MAYVLLKLTNPTALHEFSHYFALNLYNRAVRLLTSKHPPSVIYKDNKAYTPLHFAVISGHTE